MSDHGIGPLRPAWIGMGCWLVTAWVVAVEAAGSQPPAPGPSPGEAAIQSASREARAGRVEEALRLIRQEAPKHPEWSPSRIILARLLFAAGQGPAGRLELERAAAEMPDHPDVYLSFGEVGLRDNRLSDARLNFEKAQALVGQGKWTEERARTYGRQVAAGLATVAEAREDWEAARRWLLTLLELDPKNGPLRQRLGRILFRLGRPEEAHDALKQAVADAPGLEPAAVTMGWLYSRKGDMRQAEEWFDRAALLEPKSGRVQRERAQWLLEVGRAPEAKGAIEEALKLEPGSTENERLRAVIAWHLRDYAGAQRILESLRRELPADFAIANLLALCLVDQDDEALRARGLQLAEVDARQAPRSPDALSTLGWALYRSGKLDQAEQALRQATTGGRTTADIAYYLARVLADKGQKDEARKILRSATGLRGAFAHRKDADALLESLPR